MTDLCVVLDVWDPARGGLEAYAADLLRALVAAGNRVELVCGVKRQEVPDTIVVHETGSRGVAFYEDADRFVRSQAPGRVLAFRHPGRTADVFLPLGGLLASSLAARRRSEPWWLRGPKRLARALSAKTRAFLARERAFFDGDGSALCSSELVRDEIRARFPDSRVRLEVTGLPVDEQRFRPPSGGEYESLRREQLAIRDDGPCVLWIGNDPVRKGLAAARQVQRRLRLRKLESRLVLVGWNTATQDGIEPGVVGLGTVTDMEKLYRCADVVLAPSLEDNLSYSVIEALASGVPVVTTSRNGAAAFLDDGAVGRVVADPLDVHALDGATLALLERGMLRDELRERRRAAVEPCFRTAHFERLLGLLET